MDLRLFCAIALWACASACHRPGKLVPADLIARETGRRLPPLTAEQRLDALREARIFDDVDPATRDVLEGPPGPQALPFDAPVACDFLEPRADRVPAHGSTPKFFCMLESSDRAMVKVKYGRENREVVGEVLGSRLLWALGLAADANYPVRVRCLGCPEEPWLSYRDFPKREPDPPPTAAVREIDDALVQRLYPAVPLEEHRDQGWSFDELGAVDPSAGGAPHEQVDALRLLAAFIAHGDDKPENQRLACPIDAIEPVGRCRAPRLLIADLGSTFGRGASFLGGIDRASRPSFAEWSSLPMWADRAACRARLAARSSRSDPVVSEAGRQFLATRLSALSRRPTQ